MALPLNKIEKTANIQDKSAVNVLDYIPANLWAGIKGYLL